MFQRIRNRAAVVAVSLITTAGIASATPPSFVTDIGVDPTDVTSGLSTVLVPFLIAAIAIGFGFFAVKLGVRWIKGMVAR